MAMLPLKPAPKTSASITRTTKGTQLNVPIPQIQRRDNVVIIRFIDQFPAGSYPGYFNDGALWNVSPKPTVQIDALTSNNNLIVLSSNGSMGIGNATTLTSATYIIGEVVYLTDEE